MMTTSPKVDTWTAADSFAAWLASPPQWGRVVTKIVQFAVPAALVVYGIYYEGSAGTEPRVADFWLRVLVYAAAGASLFAVRRAPYLTAAVAALCWWATGSALFVVATSYLLARRQPPWWWLYLLALIALHPVGLVPAPQVFASGHALLPDEAVPVYACVVPALIGFAVFCVRRSGEQREAQFRAQAEAATARAAQVVAEDRLRMSREMHDILGHRLSLIVLNATAITATSSDERTRELGTQIAESGSATIDDLHYILDLLRSKPDVAGLDTRRQTIDDAVLLARGHGHTVVADLTNIERLPPDRRSLLESLVAECFHNATKYAPGSRIHLSISTSADAIDVRVSNGTAATAHAAAPVPGGFGLAIHAEQIHALGGVLDTEVDPAGGFAVTARIPL